jgi:hypothetical protein
MDPDETLREIRELAAKLQGNYWEDEPDWDNELEASNRLTELVQALDEWLSKGGFPPRAWNWVVEE